MEGPRQRPERRNGFLLVVVVPFLPETCMLVFAGLAVHRRTSGRHAATLSGAERQFCVGDLSGPTAGEGSVSAPGHQSGSVNFLHTASQLLSPPQTLMSREEVWGMKWIMLYKIDGVHFLYL